MIQIGLDLRSSYDHRRCVIVTGSVFIFIQRGEVQKLGLTTLKSDWLTCYTHK